MVRNSVFFITLLFGSSLNAIVMGPFPEQITLRNGMQVHKDRLEGVWNALKTLYRTNKLEYYWLWRAAKKCKELKQVNLTLLYEEANRYFLQHLKSSTIDFLKKEGVTQEIPEDAQGLILPPDAQNIIISSYYGTGEPKIVDIRYPVSTWQKFVFKLKNALLK